MHGIVAAGSGPTAEAGARVLGAGGNAVDAAVAACFATASGEPTLTSLAGGGALTYRSGETGEVSVCDFFTNAPGLGEPDSERDLDFTAVDLDFGPTTQRFHIGAGSAAVPGAIPGLCTALERWGQLPLSEVVRPAVDFLRDGVRMGPFQQAAAELLGPILVHTESARRVFAPQGELFRDGDIFAVPALADTLEALGAEPWRRYYDGVIAPAILAGYGPTAGGRITPRDLEAFQVEIRRPLRKRYRGHELLTNPPPALGGRMVAFMLRLLQGVVVSALKQGSREHWHLLCRAMRLADEARSQGSGQLEPDATPRWAGRLEELAGAPIGEGPRAPGGPGSTTHISAVDARGNAAAVTLTYGEGCGSAIGDTGIIMNNMMGEEDLFPDGFHRWPAGQRLATMVTPSVLVSDDGDVTVMGSGGANRIRSALTQVISNLVDFGHDAGQATAAPRVHFEEGVLNAEVFGSEDPDADLELGAEQVVQFHSPNIFFGGVHLVKRGSDGALSGSGDPRRDGTCRSG